MLTAEQKEIVRRARARIADPHRWCRRASARTQWGFSCEIDSPRAHRFCAFGALAVELSAIGRDWLRAQCEAGELSSKLGFRFSVLSLVRVNDSQDGHAKVLALFDKALAE
jgi:hypothetical protein